jgi:hypothetical protein
MMQIIGLSLSDDFCRPSAWLATQGSELRVISAYHLDYPGRRNALLARALNGKTPKWMFV